MAGLGILNLPALQSYWNVPIIIITETKPDKNKIESLIKELNCDKEYSEVLQKNPENWVKIGTTRLYGQGIGLSEQEMINEIKKLQTVGDMPEPLRIADIVAKAIP